MKSLTVLLIMSSQRRREPLLARLEAAEAEVWAAQSCLEARRLLSAGHGFDVLITDVTLPDGNWSDLLRYVVDTAQPVGVIIVTPTADEVLWSEVIWRGAHDLLVEPYGQQELERSLEGAARANDSHPEPGGVSTHIDLVLPKIA